VVPAPVHKHAARARTAQEELCHPWETRKFGRISSLSPLSFPLSLHQTVSADRHGTARSVAWRRLPPTVMPAPEKRAAEHALSKRSLSLEEISLSRKRSRAIHAHAKKSTQALGAGTSNRDTPAYIYLLPSLNTSIVHPDSKDRLQTFWLHRTRQMLCAMLSLGCKHCACCGRLSKRNDHSFRLERKRART